MIKKTPVVQLKGRYVLIAPWTTNPTKLYTCVAVRSFPDIYKLGIDVYSIYYVPRGMTNGTVIGAETFQFENEVRNKVNIVTLLSDDNEVIYVPDTFIAAFPNMAEVPYSHLVLSFSIGAIPDFVPIEALKTVLRDTVAQHLGLIPVVNTHRLPTDTQPNGLQHDVLETARVGSIALLETDRAKTIRLQDEVNRLRQQNQQLIAVLQANGNLPI